jgi:glycosyltransferase involved in cell wall biosynthesis
VTTRPTISVLLTTTRRDLDRLRRAVESVDRQTTDAPLELVVVDGSGESGLPPILDRDFDGIEEVVFRRDHGQGLSAARNIGLEAASGDFVALLDDDDEWLPTKLERQIEQVEPEVCLVACGVQRVDSDGNTIAVYRPRATLSGTERILRGGRVAPSPTLLVRRSTVVEEDVWFDEELPCYEDRDWVIRLSEHGRLVAVPEPLILKGSDGPEKLSAQVDPARDVACPRLLEKYDALAASYGEDCRRQFRSSVRMLSANSAFNAGDFRTARLESSERSGRILGTRTPPGISSSHSRVATPPVRFNG